MPSPQTHVKKPKAKKLLGRHSKFRSKNPKGQTSMSLTLECIAQIKIEVKRAGGDSQSVWFEDVVWKISRRRRPL